MFFSSVWNGVIAFLDWRIIMWVIGIAVVTSTASLFGLLIISPFLSEDNFGKSLFATLANSLIIEIIQAGTISLFVLISLPYLITGSDFLSLSNMPISWWPIVKIVMITMLIVFILSIAPIIGHFITNTPGVVQSLQGILIIRPLTQKIFKAGGYRIPSDWFPGALACAGYIIIGVALAFLSMYILGFLGLTLGDLIKKKKDPMRYYMEQNLEQTDLSPSSFLLARVFHHLIASVVSILPILMYGRYVTSFFIRS